ncbi:MAG: PrsW family intramembrane metalloprotease [Blastocatellia bacterium]|nr:PrsW family intramembrane metalloprotease [Blastocatellia bacterium]
MKLRLIIQSGSLTGQEFQLETGSLLLGRGTDCSLRFDPNKDAGVSTRHAVISLESDGFYITDQRSTNGTFINGSRVERALLQAGSLIQLGYQGPSLQVIIEQDNSKILPTLVQQPPILNPTVVDSPQNFFSPLAANNPVFSPTNQNRMPPNNTPLANPGFSVPINPPINPPNPQMNFPVNPNPSMNSPVYGQYGQNPASPLANGTALLKQSFSNIGVYNPEKEKNSTKTISIIASLGVMAVLMLVVGVIMLSSIGLAGSIVGTILAFTPAPFYLLLFLWLDRYDPEPAWALGGAFAWGALVAVIISFFVNTIFGAVIGGSLGDILGTVVSAPVIEEATKGLGVLLISIFLRKEFDDILDGIVYAGVVALGFATVENVLYYGREFASAGVGPGLVVILFLRGVLSPFAHALFTSMTGIGCGIARETHNKTLKIVMPLAGYIGAVILMLFGMVLQLRQV